MTIEELVNDSWQTAEDKGWHEKQRQIPELIALMHSELSEALEEYRDGKVPGTIYYHEKKPLGIGVELADVMIRIADAAKCLGIDIEQALHEKAAYNRTRQHRHGGKLA